MSGAPGKARRGPWAGGRFDIQGHRGARGLVPENTIPSFLTAIDAGVTGVELDVRLTADGHVVVWHDPTVQAEKCLSTGQDYTGARIDDLTLAQLRTLDVGTQTLPQFPEQRPVPGAHIPTLAEVFAACAEAAPDVWWTIELKVNPTDRREVASRRRLLEGVIAAVHDAGVSRRCFVHSFDWAVLDLARQLDPDLPRSALVKVGGTYHPDSEWLGSVRWDAHRDDIPAAVAEAGAHVVSPDVSSVDETLVARAHELGLAVLPWTVNDEADLRRVIAAGVDGVVTDYPDRARAVLGSPPQ
jgi:glycerophosphoryl diester phosphodiesterase